jgi:hypothetical protein
VRSMIALEKLLDFLDATLSVVLVLELGLGLGSIDRIHTEYLLDFFASLDLGVIAPETSRSSISTDEIFKSTRNLVFRLHRESTSRLTVFTDLAHSGTAMSIIPSSYAGSSANSVSVATAALSLYLFLACLSSSLRHNGVCL